MDCPRSTRSTSRSLGAHGGRALLRPPGPGEGRRAAAARFRSGRRGSIEVPLRPPIPWPLFLRGFLFQPGPLSLKRPLRRLQEMVKFLADTGLLLHMFSTIPSVSGYMTDFSFFSFVFVDGQLIKTNTTNILIRALQINKQKSDLKDATAKAATESSTGKRYYLLVELQREGLRRKQKLVLVLLVAIKEFPIFVGNSSNGYPEKTLQMMTVERLRALLKERGLSPKGKKAGIFLL
ncbi:hypothetical protein BHM03_00000409 [Ensete ventricosum]|nr:hypothetical protein BHM03_00000409 [Ensete ventricosum]